MNWNVKEKIFCISQKSAHCLSTDRQEFKPHLLRCISDSAMMSDLGGDDGKQRRLWNLLFWKDINNPIPHCIFVHSHYGRKSSVIRPLAGEMIFSKMVAKISPVLPTLLLCDIATPIERKVQFLFVWIWAGLMAASMSIVWKKWCRIIFKTGLQRQCCFCLGH